MGIRVARGGWGKGSRCTETGRQERGSGLACLRLLCDLRQVTPLSGFSLLPLKGD